MSATTGRLSILAAQFGLPRFVVVATLFEASFGLPPLKVMALGLSSTRRGEAAGTAIDRRLMRVD